MTELEHARAVNQRLRRDLKEAIRVARVWKERWYAIEWCTCTDDSHRRTTPWPGQILNRKPGHAPRVEKVK